MTSRAHFGIPQGFEEGSILADKYRVERVLGAGGMGLVVAAHHLQLDERVAIKVLLPETLVNPEAVARFAREARAAVKIKSEHVARVSDVGTLPDGSPYLVMEYLEGEDLAQWLASRGALPVEQAVEFVLQACEAIAEAHSLGIVHRDLKPANLFAIRRADGLLSIKVIDFGISKSTSMTASGPQMSMTKTSSVMGSPLYMSPEQMQSARSVDARSDLWAVGAILYELLAATTPFAGETFPELVLNVAGKPPRPIRDFRPDVPPGLEQVIIRCLEKDRDKRYQNVGELALALLEFGPKRARSSVERVSRVIQASGLSASALALPPSSDQDAESKETGTFSTWGRTGGESAPKKSRAGLVLAVVGLTLLVAAGAFLFGRGAADAQLSADPVASTEVAPVAPPKPAEPPVIAPAAPVAPEPPVAPVAAVLPGSAPSATVARAPAGRLKPLAAKPVATAAAASPAPKPTAAPSARPAPAATGKKPSGLGGRI